ncbi:prepilin peptidase [archaeon]|nr:prepilin peptidase [archaeon]
MLIFPFFFISVIGLLIATYTDLKERMVYNKLTYSIAVMGLLLKGFESFQSQSIEPLATALVAGMVAFAAAYILYRTGVWAGGDVKLVTALSILNPINYGFLVQFLPIQSELFATLTLPIFPIELIIYSAFAVLPLGVLMSLRQVFKHPEIVQKLRDVFVQRTIRIAELAILITGLNLIFNELSLIEFLVLPVLIIIAFLPSKVKIATTIIIGLIGVSMGLEVFIVNFVSIGIPLLLIYLLWKIYSESKEYAFKETIKVKDLEEGMIPDKYIVERNSKIEFVEGPSIKSVIKNLMNNRIENAIKDFKIKGRVLASPKAAGGLTNKDVKELKEKAAKGLMVKTINVRKTMAFVPAILVAYIVLQLTGDLLWNIIL